MAAEQEEQQVAAAAPDEASDEEECGEECSTASESGDSTEGESEGAVGGGKSKKKKKVGRGVRVEGGVLGVGLDGPCKGFAAGPEGLASRSHPDVPGGSAEEAEGRRRRGGRRWRPAAGRPRGSQGGGPAVPGAFLLLG